MIISKQPNIHKLIYKTIKEICNNLFYLYIRAEHTYSYILYQIIILN